MPARRARINAEASADRLAGEPRPPSDECEHGAGAGLGRAPHRPGLLDLRAVVSAHHATGHAGTRPDAELQPDLDRLAEAVTHATGQLAATLRAAGPDGPPRPGLRPLRALQRAIWLHSLRRLSDGTEPEGAVQTPAAGGEAAGLFTATDSLVDAINTAGHVLGTRRPGG